MQDAMDFKEGDRIELIEMNDPYNNVPSGAKGTVLSASPKPINVLNVKWDQGYSLNPCLDIDLVRKID